MKELLILFLEFFKTGLFAIGGGMATLPFLYDLADKYDWFTAHELADMVAVAESTPGPIGINMATYAGEKAAGVIGGIVSTLGLITPSIIIIIIIAKMLDRFRDAKIVQDAMGGIRPAATGLIAAAGWQLFVTVIGQTETVPVITLALAWINWKHMLILAVLTFAVIKWKKHPILYIVAGAVIGVVFQL